MRKLGIIFIGLFAISCAEKRPTEFPQGSGIGLIKKENLLNQTYSLTPLKALSSNSMVSSANDVEIQGDSEFNDLPRIEYTTNAPYMDDVPVRGKIGAKYKINFDLTNKYLNVNKSALKENISYYERDAGVVAANGEVTVPLFGIPVSLVKVERAIVDGEETNQLKEISVQTLEEATHVRLDLNNKKIFEAIKRDNTFHQSFFDGTWVYSSTVLEAAVGSPLIQGLKLGSDTENKNVAKIKFNKERDRLIAVNLNVDSDIGEQDSLNLNSALEFPIERMDFRRKTVNGQNLPEEEMLGDGHKNAKNWRDRQYIKVNFEKVISNVENNNAIFDNLQVGSNYLGFTIYYPEHKARVKYSLKREKNESFNHVKKQVYYKADRKYFGFFKSLRHMLNNYEIHRAEDREKNVYLNRFYEADKEIEFYFSHNTPLKYRELVKEGIHKWDKAFKKAGTDYRVTLNESKTVSTGDIRYNIINIIETKAGQSLLGYGPSIYDDATGQILAATTNIYTNALVSGLVGQIRNFVRKELGLFDRVKDQLLITSNDEMNYSSSYATDNGVNSLTRSFIDSVQQNLDQDSKRAQELKTLLKNSPKEKKGHTCSFSSTQNMTYPSIVKMCPEVKDYIESLKGTEKLYSSNELKVLEGCARKLLPTQMMGTLLHEIGHNLGLRHNFLGSTDVKNFLVKGDKVVGRSSTVMDYLPSNEEEIVDLGHYDIAAIRFGYARKVETADGKIVSVAKDQSIDDAMEDKGVALKNFKFCTDEHTKGSNYMDPMCARHDRGTTPLEVVESAISSFKSFVIVYGNGYDRLGGPRLIKGRAYNTATKLKDIYDKWRYYFYEFLGDDDKYLSNLNTPQDYLAKIEEMKNDTGVYGENFKMYYPAVQRAFEFLKELAFHSEKMCVIAPVNGVSEYVIKPFKAIQLEIFQESKTTVHDCNEAAMINSDIQVIESIGMNLNYIRKSINPEDEDYDIYMADGISGAKQAAMDALTSRYTSLRQVRNTNFAPSFMDNPIFRAEISEKVLSRLLKGINAKDVIKDQETIDLISNIKNGVIPFYKEDKNNVAAAFASFRGSLSIPGKVTFSGKLMKDYTPLMTNSPRNIEQGAIFTTYKNIFLYAKKDRAFAYKMIQERKRLDDLAELSESEIVDIPENVYSALTNLALTKEEILGSDSQPAMTLAQMFSKVQQVAGAIGELTQKFSLMAGQTSKLEEIYGFELSIKNSLEQISKQNPDLFASGQGLPAIELFAKIGVNASVFESASREILLGEEAVTKGEFIKMQVEQQIKDLEYFKEHQEEMEAKQDMLLLALISSLN